MIYKKNISVSGLIQSLNVRRFDRPSTLCWVVTRDRKVTKLKFRIQI